MSKALIIVESPAKARTLKKYLGRNFDVKASVGHVRDLPVNKLGVEVERGFEPQYVTIKGKGKVLSDLRKAARAAGHVYLAPDPDREGEAIAWHIAENLKDLKKPVQRALFYELTKKAILAAIERATTIDQHRFEAQQARRILDRLVGYQISPLLWDKVRRGLSAGRVQSVALRMICEREQEIDSFVSEEYWTIELRLSGQQPPPFVAHLDRIDGKKAEISDGEEATRIATELGQSVPRVESVEKKERKRHPSPPFITSTLQQEANRKLRFSAKKTMTLSQRLYEGVELGDSGPTGLITYMRTDSTRVNDDALAAVRSYIDTAFGPDFLPAKPHRYKTSKSAQDAHEAIRPTDVELTPEKVASYLDRDLLALYSLIWKRFVASQMQPAVFDQTTILLASGRYRLKGVGSIMRFLGFMTLYVESPSESGRSAGGRRLAPADESTLGPGTGEELPNLGKGDAVQVLGVDPSQHFTQPPPRFTEATLVKALEENGVGRPSTYASIISVITDKEYVRLDQRRFFPTDLGKLVNGLLVAHFPGVVNVEFTASMENALDKVEEGEVEWRQVLADFYGPFRETLEQARQEMKSIKRQSIPTEVRCTECGGTMVIKWGRMGEFLACENYPDCKNTQDFNRDAEGRVVPVAREEPVESGEVCDKCSRPMVYKTGRFGRFLACSGYPDCKNIRSETVGVSCPEEGCGGQIVRKVSRRGKVFYGCDKYPACKFALWDKPVAQSCPDCNAPFLVEKQSKKDGSRLVCVTEKCKFSRKMEGGE